MTFYRQGSRVEYKAIEELTPQGAACTRNAGSHGAWDVTAIFPNEVWLIQCKRCTGQFNIKEYKDDLLQLRLLKVPAFCRKFLWVWQKRKGWVEKREIIDGF